jgi:hypothetical protein
VLITFPGTLTVLAAFKHFVHVALALTVQLCQAVQVGIQYEAKLKVGADAVINNNGKTECLKIAQNLISPLGKHQQSHRYKRGGHSN